jgi:hypothetical protein
MMMNHQPLISDEGMVVRKFRFVSGAFNPNLQPSISNSLAGGFGARTPQCAEYRL